MKHFIVLFMFILLLLPACNKKRTIIITYDLKRKDYLETIDATGTIQAVNSFTVVSPRVMALNLTVTYLAKEGTFVRKGDTICILDSPDLSSQVESLSSDYEKMEADMKKLEADNAMEMALLNAQVAANKAQLAITMLDSIQLKFAPSVKKRLLALEMEKSNIEKNRLQKKLAAQRRIDNTELSQMRSRIMIQKSRIQMYQNQINSLKLASPADGLILHLVAPTVMFSSNMGVGTAGGKIEEGSTIWTDMPLLQIPVLKEMQISVDLPEADYKRIKTGQKVLIRVEAATNLSTTGKIKRKTLAGKSTQEKPSVKSYEVIISVDSLHLKMKPGLSASCRIIVDQVKDTIVVPAAAIFEKDSLKIVYVAEGEKFVPVTVETGFSNSSKSIISKGLTGNEIIALTEPPHNLIAKEMKDKADTASNSRLKNKDTIINKSRIKN